MKKKAENLVALSLLIVKDPSTYFGPSSLDGCRVSFDTSFDSKLPKLEPKLVSAISETKRLFRLFRFYTTTEV
jgi:hypothetical protein